MPKRKYWKVSENNRLTCKERNLIVCVPPGLRDALTIVVESTRLFEKGSNESQRVDELHLTDDTQTTDGMKKHGEVDGVVVVFDEKKRSFVSRDAFLHDGVTIGDNHSETNESDSDTSDEQQHNDMCEVCSQGGELLCCDTCSLVFHPNCCRPLLSIIPKEDEAWSCAYCVADGTVSAKDAGYTVEAALAYVEDMKALSVTHQFRGVVSIGKKFRAQIQINSKQVYLGNFNTPVEAAQVYDEHARKTFGAQARLNFPKADELSQCDDKRDTHVKQITIEALKHGGATNGQTQSKRRHGSQDEAAHDTDDAPHVGKNEKRTRPRYGNSADQFLFSLDSNGVGGCSSLLSSTTESAETNMGHHRTRNAHLRRPVCEWPTRTRREKSKSCPREETEGSALEKSSQVSKKRKRGRQKKAKSRLLKSPLRGNLADPTDSKLEGDLRATKIDDIHDDRVEPLKDPLDLVFEGTRIVNLMRDRLLSKLLFYRNIKMFCQLL